MGLVSNRFWVILFKKVLVGVEAEFVRELVDGETVGERGFWGFSCLNTFVVSKGSLAGSEVTKAEEFEYDGGKL